MIILKVLSSDMGANNNLFMQMRKKRNKNNGNFWYEYLSTFYIILDLNQSFKWRMPTHSSSSKNKWKTTISPSESTPSTNSPSLPLYLHLKSSKTLFFLFSNVPTILSSPHQKIGRLSRLCNHGRTRQHCVIPYFMKPILRCSAHNRSTLSGITLCAWRNSGQGQGCQINYKIMRKILRQLN